jgi:hypothetical protein
MSDDKAMDAAMTWATKEALDANLVYEIVHADKQIARLGLAEALFAYAGFRPLEGLDGSLRWAWVKYRLEGILQQVRQARYDFLPDIGREMMEVHRGVGWRAWLTRHGVAAAARDGRDVLDAVRLLSGDTVGGVPTADGALLLRWRALEDEVKRERVADWHERAQTNRGAWPRELARGAVWPTSTFDPVRWACGYPRLGPTGAVVARCNNDAGDHDNHSDGTTCWVDAEPIRRLGQVKVRGYGPVVADLSETTDVHSAMVEQCDREITKAVMGTVVSGMGDVEQNADAPLEKMRQVATREMNRQMFQRPFAKPTFTGARS